MKIWLHSFFFSRVSHKSEFYLERFLMRQHCTKQLILVISVICWLSSLISLLDCECIGLWFCICMILWMKKSMKVWMYWTLILFNSMNARVTGCELARPIILVVLSGPARHEKWPIVPCLGRRPGPWPCEAQPERHGVPCRPVGYRAVLA